MRGVGVFLGVSHAPTPRSGTPALPVVGSPLMIPTPFVPRQWKEACIRLCIRHKTIPKVSAPQQPADFRPISITPILTRMMERAVVRSFLYPAFQPPPLEFLILWSICLPPNTRLNSTPRSGPKYGAAAECCCCFPFSWPLQIACIYGTTWWRYRHAGTSSTVSGCSPTLHSSAVSNASRPPSVVVRAFYCTFSFTVVFATNLASCIGGSGVGLAFLRQTTPNAPPSVNSGSTFYV